MLELTLQLFFIFFKTLIDALYVNTANYPVFRKIKYAFISIFVLVMVSILSQIYIIYHLNQSTQTYIYLPATLYEDFQSNPVDYSLEYNYDKIDLYRDICNISI